MNRILTILIIILSINLYGQGTCASTDGVMLSITAPPVDYDELNDNGYCMIGTRNTSWHYMCFTFTPNKEDVSINMGYSSTCNTTSFRNYTLYNNSCTQVGTGLTYSGLTTGEQYTWCIEMRANGGLSCNGFDNVCPYFIESSTMPVELISLSCYSGEVIWITATEINNEYFTIYKSRNIDDWEYKLKIAGAGTKSTKTVYNYYDSECLGDTYYMLEQTDYDGSISFEGIVHCECDEFTVPEYIIEEYNVLGQVYNGSSIKILKIKKGDRIIYKKIIKI